jgi:hypothetical protein
MPSDVFSPFDRELIAELRSVSHEIIDPLRCDLETQRKQIAALQQRASRAPGTPSELSAPDAETPGARFIKSEGFQAWAPKNAGGTPASANFKAIVGGLAAKSTIMTSGNLVAPARLMGVAPFPVPPAGFIDAIPWRPIDASNQVQYLRQTSLPTPGAKTQVAEGDVKAEQSIAVALQTEPILTIACWTSASTQILLDLDMMQIFLDQSLLVAVRQEIDRQALVGVGPTAELKGILSTATPYNAALTKTGDTFLDVVSHGITQLATAGIAADVLIASPADAEALRLVKTTYGSYVFGDPASTAAPALWGVRIIVDANLPGGQFLIGLSTTAAVLDRQEAQVAISFEHADYFTRNLCVIRAEARVGLGVFIPGAWVTGNFSGTLAAGSPAHAAPAPPANHKK